MTGLLKPHLVFLGGSLPSLVECHNNNSGTKGLDNAGLADELFLANLERNGVDNALALAHLEAGLDDMELGGVDHERDLGLGSNVRISRKRNENEQQLP